MRLVVIVAGLASACTSTANVTADAPRPSDARALDAPTIADAPLDAAVPDLACLGAPAVATAPDPLVIAGTVFAIDHYQIAKLAGATVALHRRGDDGVIATAPLTGADGTYSMSVATGGAAIDAYYTIDAPGELATQIDPGEPLTTGSITLAAVASADEVARWYTDAGATYVAGTSPALVAIAIDCDHAAVRGATMTTSAAITYYDDTAAHWDPTLTASTNGFALVISNATTATITAAWQGDTFPAHTTHARAGGLALAAVSPRL